MSFLLISVLLEPGASSAEVGAIPSVGAIVTVEAPTGSVAATACDFLKKLNFIVEDKEQRPCKEQVVDLLYNRFVHMLFIMNVFATPRLVRYANWSGGSLALIMSSFQTPFYCRILLFAKPLC